MASTILLVDDDQNLLSGLQRLLHRESYAILTARCAAEAFVLLRSHSVDLILSDELMPGLSGVEFLGRVAQEFPGISCMMLTGQADLRVATKALNSGHIERFLVKPCNELTLTLTIRDLLKQRTERADNRALLDLVARQHRYIHYLEELNNAQPGTGGVKDLRLEGLAPSAVIEHVTTWLNELEHKLGRCF